MTHEEMIAFNADLMEVERKFMKKVKITKFPGVRQEEVSGICSASTR